MSGSDLLVIFSAVAGIACYAAFLYIHHKTVSKPEPKPVSTIRLVRPGRMAK